MVKWLLAALISGISVIVQTLLCVLPSSAEPVGGPPLVLLMSKRL